MDIKFGKDSGKLQQEVPAEKKNQKALLLLLLILVGGFIYLYLFTGLIKPQEAEKAVEAPAAAPQIVKMPLPPRSGEAAKAKGKAAVTAEAPKAAVPAVAASAVPAGKPAVPSAAAPPAPAKPAAAAAKPAVEAAKPAAAPAKPAAAPVAATVAKVAPTPPKPKEEAKKSAVVKPAEKKPQPAAATAKKAVGAAAPASDGKKHAAGGSWSIVVGDYVLEEALSADLGKVRKSGLAPVVKPGSRKKTLMNRLLVSEYTDRASAQTVLDKLLRHTSDAFVIEQSGKFAVYAGSYLKSEAAGSEKERLKAAGFTTTLKHADISIPSQTLSVGPFSGKKAAEAARGKLRSAGIKATLTQPKGL